MSSRLPLTAMIGIALTVGVADFSSISQAMPPLLRDGPDAFVIEERVPLDWMTIYKCLDDSARGLGLTLVYSGGRLVNGPVDRGEVERDEWPDPMDYRFPDDFFPLSEIPVPRPGVLPQAADPRRAVARPDVRPSNLIDLTRGLMNIQTRRGLKRVPLQMAAIKLDATRPNGRTVFKIEVARYFVGGDLRLIPALDHTSGIPKSGRNQHRG
jgi:hypothetical protein